MCENSIATLKAELSQFEHQVRVLQEAVNHKVGIEKKLEKELALSEQAIKHMKEKENEYQLQISTLSRDVAKLEEDVLQKSKTIENAEEKIVKAIWTSK